MLLVFVKLVRVSKTHSLVPKARLRVKLWISISQGKGLMNQPLSMRLTFGVCVHLFFYLISYFTRLHRLYASHPNVVPIVITTGVTRGGPRTVWYQQPDDANIDPFLLAQSSVSTRTFSSDLTNATSTPTLNHTLPATPTPRAPSRMPSLTKTPTPAAGQKRTIVEAMLEMSRYVTIS
jgi:hypothetical protein